MKNGINLLPKFHDESEREKKLKKIIRIATPVILLLYAFSLVSIFVYWNIQVASANDLNSKIRGTEQSINSQKETESLFRGIESKLSGVSEILNEHVNYAQVISHIEEIVPGEISLTSLVVKDDGTVDLSLQAPDSLSLTSFINSLLDDNKGGKYFQHAKLTSLVLSRDGSYLFSLNFKTKQ